MTKNLNKPLIDADSAYDMLVAEEELILHAQMLIQRVLNERTISQKALAEKLGVGESYVSQMLGTSPRNLTLRTIARVMKALDLKATLVLDDQADAPTILQSADEEAVAAVSKMGSVQTSNIWCEVVAMPSRKRPKGRQDDDARAYASYEPLMQEMALAA